jgi:hypothetical protein
MKRLYVAGMVKVKRDTSVLTTTCPLDTLSAWSDGQQLQSLTPKCIRTY